VVVPIEEWNRVSENAIEFAITLSSDVIAVHIDSGEAEESFVKKWDEYVRTPTQSAGLPSPELTVLKSPYRYVIAPTLDYILELEKTHPDRQIVVVVPILVERHWWHRFLHNQRAELLTALLLLKGNQRIAIVNVPWHLNA